MHPSARDVFETVGGTLGSKIRYLPDGETGEREQWIMWQRQVFDRHPNFEAIESEGDYRSNSQTAQQRGGGSRTKSLLKMLI